MKAVILAGGFGTRLKPLTYTTPKPMLQIVGKPVIEHIIDYLRSFGFNEIILTTNFLRSKLVDHLGDGSGFGVKINYPFEHDPLGTAGSVKNVSDQLDGTFLVIQGDNITDFDIKSLVSFHRRNGGIATMGVCPVPDPHHYGVVVADDSGRIQFFKEKPPAGQCNSNLVNTGVYVCEPEILEHIPEGMKYDFSKDLFPKLCENGLLYAMPCDGFWTDIGQSKGFNEAKNHLLKNISPSISGNATILGEVSGNAVICDGVYVGRDSEVTGPVFIDANTVIEDNCVVGPLTSIDRDIVIKEGSKIYDTTLFRKTDIGRESILKKSIIAEECSLGHNSKIGEGAMIGSNCTLGLSVRVGEGARIWPYQRISHGSEVSGDLRTFMQTNIVKYDPSWSLRHLNYDEAFYFNKQDSARIKHTGFVAKNLYEFNEMLSHVELNSIGFHLRQDTNDFSQWARKIIGDPVLSQCFDRIKHRSQGSFTEDTRRNFLVETSLRINDLKKNFS